MWSLVREGKIRPIVDQVFSLGDVARAHERMESSLNIGKIVLKGCVIISADDISTESGTMHKSNLVMASGFSLACLATPLLPHSMASAVRRIALNRCQSLRAMLFN